MDKYEKTVMVPWTMQGKEVDLRVTFEPDFELDTDLDSPYFVKAEIELCNREWLDISDLIDEKTDDKLAFAALAIWRKEQDDYEEAGASDGYSSYN